MDRKQSFEKSLYDTPLIYYYLAHHNRFKKLSRPKIKLIADEISKVSAAVPLHQPVRAYKKGEIKGVLKNLKLKIISADSDMRHGCCPLRIREEQQEI